MVGFKWAQWVAPERWMQWDGGLMEGQSGRTSALDVVYTEISGAWAQH